MQRLKCEKIYIKTGHKDMVSDLAANVMRDIPADLKACIMWGCRIDVRIKEDNSTLVVTTRYPVSILKDTQGNVISVKEKRT